MTTADTPSLLANASAGQLTQDALREAAMILWRGHSGGCSFLNPGGCFCGARQFNAGVMALLKAALASTRHTQGEGT